MDHWSPIWRGRVARQQGSGQGVSHRAGASATWGLGGEAKARGIGGFMRRKVFSGVSNVLKLILN